MVHFFKILASDSTSIKRCGIYAAYSNAHAKVLNWIFDAQFPWNWFKFGIILKDFWSSATSAIQINVSCTEFKRPKNPGIKPNYIDVGDKVEMMMILSPPKMSPVIESGAF